MLMAPRGAVTHLHHHGRIDGIWEITWDMGASKRKKTLQMSAGPTLVYQMWERLDSHFDYLIDASRRGDSDQEIAWKIKCRELAEILAMFMVPHFKSADAIAAEAMRRRDCRLKDEPVETPGVGTLRFVPPPGTKLYDDTPRTARPAKKSTSKKRTGIIPKDTEDGIKLALESGRFTVKQLADLYNVPLEKVEQLKG